MNRINRLDCFNSIRCICRVDAAMHDMCAEMQTDTTTNQRYEYQYYRQTIPLKAFDANEHVADASHLHKYA